MGILSNGSSDFIGSLALLLQSYAEQIIQEQDDLWAHWSEGEII